MPTDYNTLETNRVEHNKGMEKIVFWSIVTITSGIGCWIPTLWHAGIFSISGIMGSVIGFVVGVWLARLLSSYIAG